MLGAHDHHHDESHEQEFQWSREKTEFANILVEVAGPGMIQNFIEVSGKITLHPDHLAYVIPKVSGAVWDIRKNFGDTVERGEILAMLESREIAQAKTDYLIAQKKNTLYQALLRKEEISRAVSPLEDYLSAKLMAEEASINFQFARENLYGLGLMDEEIDHISQENPHTLRFYAIKSPLRGKVLQRNLTLGELNNSAKKVFIIANFDKMWVEMHIPQSEVRHLAAGLPVDIFAVNDKKASVQLCQFNPTINEETRMAVAVALMENAAQMWTPGEYVTAQIQVESTQAPVVIPREAVQNIDGEMVVFVGSEAEFSPQVVTLGRMDQRNVEILSGLNPGDTYAACNTFCIKADYKKEEAEHCH